MAIEKHTVDVTNQAAIYGETANINYFLKTPLAADTVAGVEVRTKDIPARTVRRYKGDPAPYSVGAVNGVRYLYDPGRKNGAATPGKEMILDDGVEKRAFTYTGAWVDIHAFILGDASMDLTAYSEGAAYVITAVDGAQTQVKKGK